MFKKIFTMQQLSLFFQIAVLINITGLFFDLIIYHYFPNNIALDLFAANLNNVSIFMICLVVISQAIIIFIDRHQQFIARYKILALTIEAFICTFFLWLLMIESDIQGKAIIFSSSLSKYDHSYKLLATLIAIFIYLVFDFYRTFTHPTTIDNKSIPKMIGSTIRLVARKHLIIFIFIFGIINFKTLNKFARALLHHSQSSLFFDFSLLEFIIPIVWIAGIIYYVYMQFHNKKAKTI